MEQNNGHSPSGQAVANEAPSGSSPCRASILNALADRVEAAEGPEREIDSAIYEAIGIDETRCKWWCKMDGRTDLTRARFIAAHAPQFTASIDAAMTLVPDGWAFGLSSDLIEDGAVAGLMRKSPHSAGDAKATTPALALTAAALRAQAIDARSDETERLGPQGESAALQGAPNA